MSSITEKDWLTKSGLRAVVLIVNGSHRCGYVQIPKDNPNYGKDYDEVDAHAHGGLTFADNGNGIFNGADETTWFVGFDCAHYGDGFLPDSDIAKYCIGEFEPKSLEFCIDECERLAEQLS